MNVKEGLTDKVRNALTEAMAEKLGAVNAELVEVKAMLKAAEKKLASEFDARERAESKLQQLESSIESGSGKLRDELQACRAECRAIEAALKSECASIEKALRSECSAVESLLRAAEIKCAGLEARIETQAAMHAKYEEKVGRLIESRQQEIGEKDDKESPVEWEFRIQRDGANNMTGVRAVAK